MLVFRNLDLLSQALAKLERDDPGAFRSRVAEYSALDG